MERNQEGSEHVVRKRSSRQVRSGAAVRILAAEDLFELGRFIETSGNQFSPESPILSSHCPTPWYCRELLASIFSPGLRDGRGRGEPLGSFGSAVLTSGCL